VGAIASEQQYNKILDHIDQARRARARLQLGGEPLQILFAIEEFTELRTIQLISAQGVRGGPGRDKAGKTSTEVRERFKQWGFTTSHQYTHDARFLDCARQTNYANELTKDE
jgi:hypothetical protein